LLYLIDNLKYIFITLKFTLLNIIKYNEDCDIQCRASQLIVMHKETSAMSDPNIKHLEFIQDAITKMNANSFQIKGLTITIVAALLVVFASTKNGLFILVSLLPVVVFCFLDAYYLMQERKFRGLYNDVAGVSKSPKELKEFEMRPDLYIGGNYSYFNVLISPTIAWLYAPLILILAGVFIFLKWY